MADASVLQVVIFREGALVGTEVFPPGDYAVGSDPGCELMLADEVVGPCAAYLSFREGKITLQDGGDGGVSINGQAQQLTEVKSLDDVGIGPFLLKFRVVGQKRPGAGAARIAPTAKPPPPARVVLPPPPEEEREATQRATMPEVAISVGQPFGQPIVQPVVPPVAPPPRPAPPRPVAKPVTKPVPAPAAKVSPPTPRPQPAPKPVVTPVAPEESRPAPKSEERQKPRARTPHAKVHSDLDALPDGRHWRRMEPFPGVKETGPDKAELAAVHAGAQGKEPVGPSLRVRVFWGKSSVGVYGFPFGKQVSAGPAETRDVPLYRIDLPSADYQLARCEKSGWVIRVPKSLRAFRFEAAGWRPADGAADGDAVKVPLEQGRLLRIGDASYSVELRVDRVKRAPRAGFMDLVRTGAILPFALVAVLSAALGLGLAFMPKYSKESSDFTPQQMLRAAKAILKPPEKKKEEKKKAEEKKVEKVAEKAKDPMPDVPKSKVQQVSAAMKAVQKVVSAGPAVESLLKATSKLGGGPKGYGDKGMGYKISPLIGKPPIAMAGMGFGQGLGGFGTETKGMGAIRGMGGGGGGGIGTFAAGGTGKGKVASIVTAQASSFHTRAGGGTLSRDLIAKVINEHLGEVRGCYERALLKQAGLAGKLNLEWTIDTTGHVEEVKVKQSTIPGSEVPNCIVGSLKTWVFPKPTGGKVIVSYPFLFNSVGF